PGDARKLPSPKDGVRDPTGVTHECLALPKRQLPDGVSVDAMSYIEVGAGIVQTLANGINDKSAIASVVAKAAFGLQPRSIGQRMGVSVVEVHRQTAETLPQRNRESIIVGISDRAPSRQRPILWLH